MTKLCVLMVGLLLGNTVAAQTVKKGRAPVKPAAVKSDGLAKDAELYRAIAEADAKLFAAYNNCDLEAFASFFPEELEFYHDNGGNPKQTRQSLTEAIKNNICHKVNRHLVPGTLKVYPMKDYGAVAIGRHRFSHLGRDNVEPMGEAQFVMLWQKQPDGSWKCPRTISFDHHEIVKR